MKVSSRSLALLLVLLAVFGVFSGAAFAAGEEPAGAAAPEDGTPPYILREETVITEDETPLGAVPSPADMFVEHECCILHLVLMLAALGVAVCYAHDRKRCQQRQFEVRSAL